MTLKNNFKSELESLHSGLIEVNDWMYENPETGFEEFETSKHLVNYIKQFDENVLYPTSELDTAFEITFGKEGPLIVLCVEYDALPEIGHACGHNIIATCSIGAGLGLRNLVEELGIRVKLLGTPAEEGGGGKIILLERGAFEDAKCSMMIHPGPYDVANPTFSTIQQYKVEFFGKDAHAAGAPEEGINALDAQIQLFVNASTFRQQMLRTDRMHGVIKDGGFKPNIIPSYTSSEWYLRSLNEEGLNKLEQDFLNFVNAAAISTKCKSDVTSPDFRYKEILNNQTMYELFMNNCTEIGRDMPLQDPGNLGLGSTDMGNISFAMPSIHPMISIEANGAVNHQPEFAAATTTISGHKAIFDGAYGMGATIIDLAENNLWEKL